MSVNWKVGDHPKARMPSRFVVAVDRVISAERDVAHAECALRSARRTLTEAREHMHEVMPPEIDNAKVGFRLTDVFAWRKR